MFVTVVSIFCDHHDCADWAGNESSRAEALRVAGSTGWLVKPQPRGARHFCPLHRPDRLIGNPALAGGQP